MLYFLTVNYQSSALIDELAESIGQLAGLSEHQIVIIDNSPGDASIQAIASKRQRAQVIQAQQNLGFGGSYNLGIQKIYASDPEAIIWLINPDARLVQAAWQCVSACLKREPKTAILGTRIQDLASDVWFYRGTFNRWTGSLKHRCPGSIATEFGKITDSKWVSGCSLILNLAAFHNCPQFDTHFFLDYEDADICETYRQQGYRVAITQSILVTHAVSAITHRDPTAKFQHATFSKLYLLWKHATGLALWLNVAYMGLLGLVLWPYNAKIAQGRQRGWRDFGLWWLRQRLGKPYIGDYRPKSTSTIAHGFETFHEVPPEKFKKGTKRRKK